jgi:hypothetical protein
VAPIALYPDELVSQMLAASTYPLELVQAWQCLQRSPGLTGAALAQAAQQQNWDPSIQALVVFPDLVKRLNQDINWTTDLGNAFLAQPPEVMDAGDQYRHSGDSIWSKRAAAIGEPRRSRHRGATFVRIAQS